MKKLFLILLSIVSISAAYSQHDLRATFQIGRTETLYHNEMIYGLSCAYDHIYVSLGTTSNPEYDYHSYKYLNVGYVFDICKYFSIGPTFGYSFQKGYNGNTYNVLNYGYVMHGMYPLKGISHNGGLLIDFEMTRHHTNYGIGIQVFF